MYGSKACLHSPLHWVCRLLHIILIIDSLINDARVESNYIPGLTEESNSLYEAYKHSI